MTTDPTRKPPPYAGGCACGAVRYTITERALGSRLCHCRLRQKVMAGPVLAQASFPTRSVTVTGEVRGFPSSQRLLRQFCPQCGTQLLLKPIDQPERTGILLATLDDPEAFQPEMHLWTSSAIAWPPLEDGRPRYEAASSVAWREVPDR